MKHNKVYIWPGHHKKMKMEQVSDGSEEFYVLSQIAWHTFLLAGERNTKVLWVQRHNKALRQRTSEFLSILTLAAYCALSITCLLHEAPLYVHRPANLSLAGLISPPPTQLLCWPWHAVVSFPSSSPQSWAVPSSPLTASEAAHELAHLFIYFKQ